MKKIKMLGLVIVAALFAASFTGCSGCRGNSAADASSNGAKVKKDTSLKDLKKRKVFVLGLDDAFPPMGFRDDDGNIVGFDIDLATEVAKRLGVKFKAQPIDWDAKEMELATGKVDCIWNGFSISEDRKAALELTEAYLKNEQVLVVHADSEITDFEGIAGKVVGVQSGSTAQIAVDGNEDFKKSLKDIVFYKENVTALNDLLVKGIDGVVMDKVVAQYDIAKEARHLTIVEQPLAEESYAVAFRKGDVALRDEVQKILEKMTADGTVKAISEKWFGADLTVIGK